MKAFKILFVLLISCSLFACSGKKETQAVKEFDPTSASYEKSGTYLVKGFYKDQIVYGVSKDDNKTLLSIILDDLVKSYNLEKGDEFTIYYNMENANDAKAVGIVNIVKANK